MKKYFYLLAALSIAPNFALAQGLDSDVDTELDQVVAPQATARSSSQPIYILNQATPTATSGSVATQNQESAQVAVQKQPVTLVQATPLNESRAEQIRKARQDAELQTEQKIVEKLEVSRMDDEKKRANVLFGDKFQQLQEGNGQNVQQVQVQAVQAAPVVQQPVYVAPAPVQEVKADNTRDIVREEIRSAMKSEEEVTEAPLESRYFGAVVGIGDYPEVKNVKGNYSLGAQFGTKYDQFIVEGTFLYSNYRVETGVTQGYGNYGYNSYAYSGYGYVPNAVDVNQYSGSLAAKYELFGGFIRPVVGGLVQYSYRTFSWANDVSYGYNPNMGNNSTASSHAIDVGVVGGADLAFTPKFALGLDFRYMFNMASRIDSNNSYWMTSSQYGTPIEKLQYYVMSLVGKVTF